MKSHTKRWWIAFVAVLALALHPALLVSLWSWAVVLVCAYALGMAVRDWVLARALARRRLEVFRQRTGRSYDTF